MTTATMTAKLTTAFRGTLWWVRSVMGDLDYQRYVEHTRRHHADSPVISEREFWRRRHAAADATQAPAAAESGQGQVAFASS